MQKLIILDIHTPGGAVDAAGQIAKLLDSTLRMEIIAYINDDALSAGAFLHYMLMKSICRQMDELVQQQ